MADRVGTEIVAEVRRRTQQYELRLLELGAGSGVRGLGHMF